MARFTCRFCKAPLPVRRARCRSCGWAIDYDPETSRRMRELAMGVGFIALAAGLAVAFAVAYYVGLLP
jgi:hypothetical protein